MEAKLKEYRAIRRRKEIIDTTKEKIKTTKRKLLDILTPKFIKTMKEKKEEELVLLEEEEPERNNTYTIEDCLNNETTSDVSEEDTIEEVQEESWRYCLTKWSIYIAIWFTLYIIFLKLQFGAVYFVVTALLGIYFNTRTRPRKKGEISAYSVFNENCKSIDGTLKPEQFEREIMYGPGSVR